MFEEITWSSIGVTIGVVASLVTIFKSFTWHKREDVKNNVAINTGSDSVVNNVSSSGSSTINITKSSNNSTLVPESLAEPDFRMTFPQSSRGTSGPSNCIKVCNYGGHAYKIKISCSIKIWGESEPKNIYWEFAELGRSQDKSIMVKTTDSCLILKISCLDANGVDFLGRYQCNLNSDLNKCSFQRLSG